MQGRSPRAKRRANEKSREGRRGTAHAVAEMEGKEVIRNRNFLELKRYKGGKGKEPTERAKGDHRPSFAGGIGPTDKTAKLGESKGLKRESWYGGSVKGGGSNWEILKNQLGGLRGAPEHEEIYIEGGIKNWQRAKDPLVCRGDRN